jgi:TetR/AcrR family transcriptional repressor of nem operon
MGAPSRVLFAEALFWMEKQFEALGKGADSPGCAVHLLSATQGVSVLAHTFQDPTYAYRLVSPAATATISST